MPSLWAPYKEHTTVISSRSTVRYPAFLNNFDREKNVIFNGLIREICYGIGTEYLLEWVEPLR